LEANRFAQVTAETLIRAPRPIDTIATISRL
jgi:hypothetical protein